jgi:citrate synthase
VLLALIAWLQHRSNAKTARELQASNRQVAEQAQKAHVETTTALGAIHTLVNSNLTSAQQRELAAMRDSLKSSREVISLKQDRGMPVTPETLDAIEQVETRISELARDLVHKQEQTDIADAQTERQQRGGES